MPTAANDDLATLAELNQDILLHELENRYIGDQIYVSEGLSFLLINNVVYNIKLSHGLCW